MAKQTSLYLPKGIKTALKTLVNSDSTNWVTVYTAAADDAVIKGLLVTSDATGTVNLKVGIYDGAVTATVATIAIPASSGTNGTAVAIDALNATDQPGLPLDRDWKRCLPLQGGMVLKIAAVSAVPSAKTVAVTAIVEEY